MPTQRLLHGLAQTLPLLLLAAMLCLTLASFRQPGQGRGGALRGAIGLILLLIAGIATHQAIFRWIFLPAVASGQFDEAQLVGARTAPGDPAPHFAVTTIDGRLSKRPIYGKVLLINFFSISSAACDQQLAQWQDLWNQFHADSRLRMLAIGRGESVEAVRAFAAEKGFAFVLTADPDRAAFDLFAFEGVPRVYLISREGKIVFQSQGYHDGQTAELARMLQAESPGGIEDRAQHAKRPGRRICGVRAARHTATGYTGTRCCAAIGRATHVIPSSRTPEGQPHECPVCGTAVVVEPSLPPGDAPCPHCGCLLWFPGGPGSQRAHGFRRFVIADESVRAKHEAIAAILDRLVETGAWRRSNGRKSLRQF